MCNENEHECQCGTPEAFNAEVITIERAMRWNGVEVTHGGDLVWVQTAWAVGAEL